MKRISTNRILNEMLFQAIYGLMMIEIAGAINYMVDGIIVGRYLGESALAATGITGPIFSILTIISGVLASGFQSIAGRELGEGKRKEAQHTWQVTWFSALILSFIMMVYGFFGSSSIASLLGAPASQGLLHTDASAYLKGFLLGSIPYVFSALLVPVVQINGKNSKILLSIAAMTVVDILGNFISILVFHGGMYGIGLATSASYVASTLVLLTGTTGKKATLTMAIQKGTSAEGKRLLHIIRPGLPKATKRICNSLRPMILNRLILALAGSAAMTAMSIQGNVRYILESAGVGISGAVLLLTGIFLGEMNYSYLKEMRKKCMVLIWGGISGIALLYFILVRPIASLFVATGTDTYSMTLWVLRCHAISLPFLAYNEYCMASLQSKGKLPMTHLLNILQRLLVILVLSFLLGHFIGIQGIWLAIPLNEMVISLFAFISTRKGSSAEGQEHQILESIELSLEDKAQLPELLSEVDIFLDKIPVEEKTKLYARLFCEELMEVVCQLGFEDKRKHELNLRLLYTSNGLILRTKDDCHLLAQLEEKRRGTNIAPDDPLLGAHMVFTLAKQVEYMQTLRINQLLIRL